MIEEFYEANCLKVSADTTGFRGGDGGHGGQTTITIEDLGGTSFDAKLTKDGIALTMYGDSELRTLYKGINFIKHALEYYEPALREENKK